MEYEIFEHNRIKVYISKEHRFGTDSLLLGEFAGNVKRKTVVDLCSGCGIIPFMLCGENPPDTPDMIFAVEIQTEAADLIDRTARKTTSAVSK
jgi:tRNA1(Val) A37 N6-methylase TrmN6